MLDLLRPAGERRVRTARDRGCICAHRDESERPHRARLSTQLKRLEFRRVHRVSDECVRRVAEQDLLRLGTLLETRGDVHRVTRRETLGGPGHDHARTDTDTGLDTERRQRVAHLDRGAAGAKSVVLVRSRNAEHGHHRVPDELLHRSAVRLHDLFHPLEVARQQRPKRLRVGRLTERSRAGHIAEEHRDRLPHLTFRRLERHRSGAEAAELEALRVLLPAGRTDRHGASLIGHGSAGNTGATRASEINRDTYVENSMNRSSSRARRGSAPASAGEEPGEQHRGDGEHE